MTTEDPPADAAKTEIGVIIFTANKPATNIPVHFFIVTFSPPFYFIYKGDIFTPPYDSVSAFFD